MSWRWDFGVDGLCTVLAFDPGETTGWCAIGVQPQWFWGYHGFGTPLEGFDHYKHGQIDCVSKDLAGWFGVAFKHAGLNMMGENAGIEEMLKLACTHYPKSVVVIEDFIPDMNRMDQARHTLSPVRITAGFSFGMSQYSLNGKLSDERIFVQNRSLAKTTCTDDRLKRWGMYDPKGGRHARDAVRHAYYFLRDCVGDDHRAAFKRHLAWPHLFDDPANSDTDGVIQKPKKRPNRPRKEGELI